MLRIDHATVAWSDLDPVVDEFTELGLAPVYGGVHDNEVTHMSIVGFTDGSYIELLSTVAADTRSPLWAEYISGDAGPTAWAIEVDDVAAFAKRSIDADLPVNGPRTMTRERPDGTVLEWDLAFINGYGETLPFVIRDRTPREYRVQPRETITSDYFSGIAEVVIAQETIDPEPFRRLHRFPDPVKGTHDDWNAALGSFPGQPATLAAPRGEGWLADRVDRFGPSPCAFLLGTSDLGEVQESHPIARTDTWFGHRVGWFDTDLLDGMLGVVETTDSTA